jgi:hypothetical protein
MDARAGNADRRCGFLRLAAGRTGFSARAMVAVCVPLNSVSQIWGSVQFLMNPQGNVKIKR